MRLSRRDPGDPVREERIEEDIRDVLWTFTIDGSRITVHLVLLVPWLLVEKNVELAWACMVCQCGGPLATRCASDRGPSPAKAL